MTDLNEKALEAAVARAEKLFEHDTFKRMGETLLLTDEWPVISLSYIVKIAVAAYLSTLAEESHG